MNKRILAITFVAIPAFWLAGCQAETTKPAAPTASMSGGSAEQAIANAKAAEKAAAAAGNEWRDTGKMIKSAEAALAAGDSAKAEKLAAAAEFQGHAAEAQAKENQNAGNPDYLYQ
jgi:hypothetical protein